MPGPLHAPLLLILYPFRFRDAARHPAVSIVSMTSRKSTLRQKTASGEVEERLGGVLLVHWCLVQSDCLQGFSSVARRPR